MIDNLKVELIPEHAIAVRRLSMLAEELKGPAVRRGLDVASKPIFDHMKASVGVHTGLTRRAINRIKLSKSAAARLEVPITKPGEVAFLIGPNRRVEGRSRSLTFNRVDEGTAPHEIRPRNSRVRKFARAALNIHPGWYRSVQHPGIRPRKILEGSLAIGQAGFEERFFRGLTERLDKVVPQG